MFRYRQRGVPVEVSPAERDRAIEHFTSLNRTAGWIAAGSAIAGHYATVRFFPQALDSIPIVVALYVSVAISASLMMRRAWNEPTRT